MSGIIGHTTYAMLALKEALKRGLRTAPIAVRHYSSFLAGAYLGSDIQTMPSVICEATGKEAGYGGVPYQRCPGEKSTPFTLKFGGESYLPGKIHNMFYGRAHLFFGFTKEDQGLRVPWDHLPEYFVASLHDAIDLYGPSERMLAYLLGWTVHVVSDSIIKSFQPGLTLKLLDGTYTPKNRPIQDLFAFHEVGIRELGVNWVATLADVAATPVEPVQTHVMRISEPRGELAKVFGDGWKPAQKQLLTSVLVENRRWAVRHFADEIEEMQLDNGEANQFLRQITGLRFKEMMEAAKAADLRGQIGRIATEAASMIEAVERRSIRIRALSTVPF